MKKYFCHVLSVCLGFLMSACGPKSVCEPNPESQNRPDKTPVGRCELPSSGKCPELFVKVVSETPLEKGEKCDYTQMVAL